MRKAMGGFLLAGLLLHRPAMLAGNYADLTTLLPRWDFALLAAALILLEWERLILLLKSLSRWSVAALLILLLSALGHFFVNGYWTLESLGLNLAFLTIPLFGALNRDALRRLAPPFLCVFWLIDFLLTAGQWGFGKPLTGIAGNWNWNATLLLFSVPFVCLWIIRKSRCRRAGWVLASLAALLSAFLIVCSGSRASLLAFAGAAGIGLFLFLPGRGRKILLFSLLGVLLGGTALLTVGAPERLDAFLKDEIRPVIWESTLALIADHPLGVGAESFEEAYIPYKTAEYFFHRHAAWRTLHPHNEFLNIAACLGIPALLGWCFLTFKGIGLFLLRFRKTRPEEKLIFFGFTVLLIHGMVDLVFVAWPLDLFALLFAGFFWAPRMLGAEEDVKFHAIPRVAGVLALCGVLLSAGVNFAATRMYETARRAVPGSAPGRAELRAAALTTAFPEALYRAVESALLVRQDPRHALDLAGFFRDTPYRNMGRIHGFRALALARLGRDAEALEEYRKDSACYPYLLLPYVGQIGCLGRLGRTAEIPAVEKRLAEIMKIRGISRAGLLRILQDPERDKPNSL